MATGIAKSSSGGGGAPAAHVTTHQSGGTDPLALDTLAAPTDIVTLNASTTAHGLLKKLDNVATNFLNGQGNWAAPAGAAVTQDVSYYRQVGTSPIECWYPCGMVTSSGAAGTLALSSASTLFAMPFIVTRASTVDRIAISVSTASANNAQNCRLGIYSATSATNLYPSALVLDAGTVNLSGATALPITISQALTANTLYWATLVTNQTDAVLRSFGTGMLFPIFGATSTLGASSTYNQISVAQAYGALPATFPAGAAISSTGMYGIWLRYSA